MHRCVLAAGLALAAALPAAAQGPRTFPSHALRGTLEVVQAPEILLNGRPALLAPGARVRGEDNLYLLAGNLAGQKLLVHYTVELHGLVHSVWILTADELARGPWPTTAEESQRWSFDPVTQTWARR